jgi:hypothetical protein
VTDTGDAHSLDQILYCNTEGDPAGLALFIAESSVNREYDTDNTTHKIHTSDTICICLLEMEKETETLKGSPTMLITALGSWEKQPPCGHLQLNQLIINNELFILIFQS